MPAVCREYRANMKAAYEVIILLVWPWLLCCLVIKEQLSFVYRYRSPVKEWQVRWFVLGTITLNDTDTSVKRLDRNMKTFSVTSSAIFANNGVCVIQSYCPKNKPADLPPFYWRPVHTWSCEGIPIASVLIVFSLIKVVHLPNM